MTRDTQMDFMGEPASEHSAMMPIRAVVEHPHITPRTLDLTGSSRALGGRERLGNGPRVGSAEALPPSARLTRHFELSGCPRHTATRTSFYDLPLKKNLTRRSSRLLADPTDMDPDRARACAQMYMAM